MQMAETLCCPADKKGCQGWYENMHVKFDVAVYAVKLHNSYIRISKFCWKATASIMSSSDYLSGKWALSRGTCVDAHWTRQVRGSEVSWAWETTWCLRELGSTWLVLCCSSGPAEHYWAGMLSSTVRYFIFPEKYQRSRCLSEFSWQFNPIFQNTWWLK